VVGAYSKVMQGGESGDRVLVRWETFAPVPFASHSHARSDTSAPGIGRPVVVRTYMIEDCGHVDSA
jgi:hypothetical protein